MFADFKLAARSVIQERSEDRSAVVTKTNRASVGSKCINIHFSSTPWLYTLKFPIQVNVISEGWVSQPSPGSLGEVIFTST